MSASLLDLMQRVNKSLQEGDDGKESDGPGTEGDAAEL